MAWPGIWPPTRHDLLANLHLHLGHEVDLDKVVEITRTSAAAEMSLADAIERALPELGCSGALNVLLAAYSLAAPLWQIAHPSVSSLNPLSETTCNNPMRFYDKDIVTARPNLAFMPSDAPGVGPSRRKVRAGRLESVQ
jgi:hypothetical protein